MKPQRSEIGRCQKGPVSRRIIKSVLLALLLAFMSASSVIAGSGTGLSDPFLLNTSNGVQNRVYAVSDPAFPLNTRFPGGGVAITRSGSFILDTRLLTLAGIEVTGPPTVEGGKYAAFTATAIYTGGLREDVTGQAEWSVVGGPADSRMVGNLLSATATTVSVGAAVTARFSHSESTRSGRLLMTITPGMTTNLGEVQLSPGVGNRSSGTWTITALAETIGGSPPYTHTWSLLPTVLGVSGTNPVLSTSISSTPGRRFLRVDVQDSAGRTTRRTLPITLPVPAVANEPTGLRTASALENWSLRNADDSGPLVIDPTRKDAGLIVICHGLKDGPGLVGADGQSSEWQKTMAANIAARLVQEGKPLPNIALLDWRDGAEPSVSCAEGCSVYDGAELAWWQEETNQITALFDRILGERSLGGIGRIRDYIYIRPNGLQQGQALADWIKTETDAGHLSASAPIQLIGHSAGGFVAGECGLTLKNVRLPIVDQVTMLDTPFPMRNHFTAFTEGPTGGRVDRYISSIAGQCAPTLEMRKIEKSLLLAGITGNAVGLTGFLALKYATVEPDERYYRRDIPDGPLNPLNIVARHSWAWEWYTRTAAVTSTEQDGFFFSPFLMNNWQSPVSAQGSGNQFASLQGLEAPPPAENPLMTGWTSFGTVATDGTGFTLTEGTGNAGIFQNITFPPGAESLIFKVQFTQAGDGDFLAVYFGDQPALYAISDLPVFRAGLTTFDVPVGAFAEAGGKLVIKLETAGATQCQVRVENLRIRIDDDLDHDGLSNDQEQGIGTYSNLWDSDGDNLSDGAEFITLLTNPLADDTDHDGQRDDRELIAGTDPLNGTSVFRIGHTQKSPGGGVLLQWPSVIGKRYRVFRSPDLIRSEVDVVASTFIAATTSEQITDPAPPPSGRAFYWVEVLE